MKDEKCNLCNRNCNVDRSKITGYCRANDKVQVSLVSTHNFEEPCLSQINGSGTVFFTNCNLRCIYCQNYEISQEAGRIDEEINDESKGFERTSKETNNKSVKNELYYGKTSKAGKEISVERLAEIFLEQQARNVNNINLVTPTMYVYQIIEAIKIAKKSGLKIPIVYNTNSYENVETIKMLEGYIDIYLPDLKYYRNDVAEKYSKAPNYFEVATKAIKEMQRQIPNNEFDENGTMLKGVIVRHLILPNHIQNTKNILKWIKENLNEETYVSVMAQYFPTYKAKEDESINRKITLKEYREVENYLYSLGIKNGYMQDLGKHEEEYVPTFDLSNV